MTEKKCQHRWEPSTFGEKYWEPNTWQFTCKRCGGMKMIRTGGGDAPDTTEVDSQDTAQAPVRADG